MTSGDWTPAGTGQQPPPMNAPRAVPLGVGVQPGTPNVIRARQVIVFGPNDGVFVYSGSPAAGHLIASIAPVTGTDPYGNVYLEGTTGYWLSGGNAFAVGFSPVNNAIAFSIASSQAGPYTTTSTVGVQSSGGAITGLDLTASSIFSWVLDNAGNLSFLNSGIVQASLIASALGHIEYSSLDGNTYNTGTARYRLTSAQGPISTTSGVTITSISNIPVAADPYLIRGTIIVDQGATAAVQAIQIHGPTVTAMDISWNCIEGSSVFDSGVQTSLGQNLTTGAIPATSIGELHFDGIISFSAAGLLGLTALCVTSAADPWTVGRGSYLEISPIG